MGALGSKVESFGTLNAFGNLCDLLFFDLSQSCNKDPFKALKEPHSDLFATKGELSQTNLFLDLIKISNGNLGNQKSIERYVNWLKFISIFHTSLKCPSSLLRCFPGLDTCI